MKIVFKHDMLDKKKDKLDRYVEEGRYMMEQVTYAVHNLLLINESIDHEVDELDRYQSEIEDVRDRFIGAAEENQKTIEKIEAIIGVPEQEG